MLIQELARYSKGQRASVREAGAPSSESTPPMLLILSPTRELALQIADEAKTLLSFHKLNVLSIGFLNILKIQ